MFLCIMKVPDITDGHVYAQHALQCSPVRKGICALVRLVRVAHSVDVWYRRNYAMIVRVSNFLSCLSVLRV